MEHKMAVDLTNMSGNVILCADSTATTNSLACNVKFSNVAMNRGANGNMEMTIDFESDGAVTVNGFTATTAVDIAGFGGKANLYEGTVTTTVAFQADLGAWSASIKGDTHPYSSFDSQWKKTGLGTFQMTGSASGVATTGQLMPAV